MGATSIAPADPPSASDWAPALVGQTLAGRYRLGSLLAQGGMGAVFEAEHVSSGEAVAVKVLLPELHHVPRAVERLQREASRAAEAEHPGVVAVRDFGVDPERGAFLAMERLEGESLSSRLARVGRLAPETAVALGTELLEVLAAVHRCGVLHRDLKPANLFLARDGAGNESLKVLDFGLARSLLPREGEATLTVPGTVVGTPRYMAPEQASADRAVDRRADIYGVGAVLYRCLSGQAPYAEWGAREVILAVRAGPCSPLRDVAPSLCPALCEVVDRAMRPVPAARYADAEAMGTALAAVDLRAARGGVRDEPTIEESAEQPPPHTRSGTRVSRPAAERSAEPIRGDRRSPRRSVAWGVALAAALAVAGLVVVFVVVFVGTNAGTEVENAASGTSVPQLERAEPPEDESPELDAPQASGPSSAEAAPLEAATGHPSPEASSEAVAGAPPTEPPAAEPPATEPPATEPVGAPLSGVRSAGRRPRRAVPRGAPSTVATPRSGSLRRDQF